MSNKEAEINVYGMIRLASGDCTLNEGSDNSKPEPDFYDVQVRCHADLTALQDDGSDIELEYDYLTSREVDAILPALEARYGVTAEMI